MTRMSQKSFLLKRATSETCLTGVLRMPGGVVPAYSLRSDRTSPPVLRAVFQKPEGTECRRPPPAPPLRPRDRKGSASGYQLLWAAWYRASEHFPSARTTARTHCKICRSLRKHRRRRDWLSPPEASFFCPAARSHQGIAGPLLFPPPAHVSPRSCRKRSARL